MQPRNMSMSGVVDLGAVKAAGEAKQKAEQARREQAARGDAGAVAPSQLVFDVTEETFEQQVLAQSDIVPVVIDFHTDRSPLCAELSPVLERAVLALGGRLALARIDVDANLELLRQFGVQSVPAVYAVVAGQAMPLFQGVAPQEQIAEVFDQLIAVAEERFGLTGLTVDGEAPPREAAAEPPMDPALAAGHEALDQGDYAGAIQAYQNVLNDNPGDTEAKLALAQADLLLRVRDLDPAAVRQAAAADPADVDAQISAADLDLAGGHVEDAFGRLVDTVRRSAGEERDRARVRLLELFELVGSDDPRVSAARGALARVLF
ncbi:tetratricopeptide repeat protein [Streptomyces sp. SL13]|uniref:Tetratricopeptide repeat protein n=1 Tax=Streptantibioticus silvisoli TaxID=2705255 RepID=A0AA90H0M7_9ACTN|nr:tetratricopeptide repeat protein [Streptantibioticus silvisoli]MDI5962719.1 tetratricopeptide repeat protein [Streptantibioticus silvisoli]MDI5968320.1 tetratricopeptide repeat protein [Streptantibioticus silvisoli]